MSVRIVGRNVRIVNGDVNVVKIIPKPKIRLLLSIEFFSRNTVLW